MNVNPSSEDFTRVVPWDSLTDEQKASGDWIELPSTATDATEPTVMARKKTGADRMTEMFREQKQYADSIARRLEIREHREATREGIWPSRR